MCYFVDQIISFVTNQRNNLSRHVTTTRKHDLRDKKKTQTSVNERRK